MHEQKTKKKKEKNYKCKLSDLNKETAYLLHITPSVAACRASIRAVLGMIAYF